jgi:endoglucanase
VVDFKLLKKLMDINGVSGSEEAVRALIKKEIKPFVDKVWIDKAGNLIAHQEGPKPTIMLAAHMDEIGLMVEKIDDKGRIFFDTVGDIENLTLLGERVLIEIKGKPIHGVITTRKLSEGEEIEELPESHLIFVDTGLKKKELIKIGVRTGTYLNLIRDTVMLGNKKIVSGKAIDDRAGCYILIETIKKCWKTGKNEMYFVFTVQEEVGLYGAKTSAYELQPDWAIAVEVTNADDIKSDNPIKVLGKGPAVTVKDAELIGNKRINSWLEEIAKKKKIPLQFDVSEMGTTDALSIYLSRGGVPASVLTVPVRNIHSTVGIVNTDDIDNAVKLLGALLIKPPKAKVV